MEAEESKVDPGGRGRRVGRPLDICIEIRGTGVVHVSEGRRGHKL